MQIEDTLFIEVAIVFFGLIAVAMADEGAFEFLVSAVVQFGQILNEELLLIEIIGWVSDALRMQSSE